MFTKINTYKNQSKNNLNFKGSTLVEDLRFVPKGNVLPSVNHKTSLFRDFDILTFTINHLNNTFPNSGTIVHAACSTGEELYSTKMLSHEKGLNYQFIGYDIGPKAIEQAKEGFFFNDTDSVFLNKNKIESNRLGIGKTQIDYLKTLLEKNFHIDSKKMFCCPKTVFKNGVYFNVENINTIQNQNIPKDTRAIFFKSAFYHITGNHWSNPDLKKEIITKQDDLKIFLQSGIDKMTHIARNVHKNLPKKGLFIIGNSEYDRLYSVPFYSKQSENGIINLFEDKSQIETINSLLKENNLKHPLNLKSINEGFLDLVLRKEGFEPIKYSDIMQNISSKVYNKSLKLASVWMKK